MVLTDKEFFEKAVDYGYPGFEDIEEFVKSGDFKKCRELLSTAVKKAFKPELYFTTVSEDYDREAILDGAEKACRHYMVSVKTPMDFKGGPVDWFANPTYNKYKEWTWQLSRHAELVTLAKAYRITSDMRYADACAELINSWFEQANAPSLDTCGYDTLCWRTIECGIRMGWTWPIVMNTFVPVWDDDTVCNLCKSVYEHGLRLHKNHTVNNWLIMEMNGLCHIGMFFPFLSCADEWYKFAMDKLTSELEVQVYPDGTQNELTPNYQRVIVINYLFAIKTALAYGRDIPQKMIDTIELTIEYYVHLMSPARRIISLNDGNEHRREYIPDLIKEYTEFYPDNKTFKWLYGKEGGEAPCKDYIFEYAGLAALRTDWSENAVMLVFDGGLFGAGHQHEDKLSIVLCADGKELLVDPGGYAYDDSPMRMHILESASHNTVLVDGMGQNRRSGYKWNSEDIGKKADMRYSLSDDVDVLSAYYDEGYGENKEKCARHERKVLFVKKLEGLRPFVIVIDRLYSLDEKEHCYDVLWHVDSQSLSVNELCVKADNLRILVGCNDVESVGLEICRGRKKPDMQGWTADSMKQGDYRPIYAAIHKLTAKDMRHITVLYPDGGDSVGVCSVEAGAEIADTKIILCTDDGQRIVLDEKDYRTE